MRKFDVKLNILRLIIRTFVYVGTYKTHFYYARNQYTYTSHYTTYHSSTAAHKYKNKLTLATVK